MDNLPGSELNDFYAHVDAINRDTPARQWFYAQAMHPAIYRALRMDAGDHCATYAAMPFRLHQDETGARILVAMPCPLFFEDDDFLGVDTVLAWNPRTGKATVWGDDQPDHVTGKPTGHIYADAFAFMRAYAEARAQWWEAARFEIGDKWRTFREADHTPGQLLIGDPAKVHWPARAMPADLTCHGVDPAKVNRALLSQARIPRARAANQYREAA